MRILAISDIYYPQAHDVAIALRTLLREMQAKGHEVTLIAPDYGRGRDDPAEDIIRVSSHTLPFGSAEEIRVMKVHRVLELAERLRGWSYDMMHIHTPFVAHLAGVALARRLRLPIIETWSTSYEEILSRYAPFMRPGWRRAVAAWASRMQCHRVDGVLVGSNDMRDRLTTYQIERPIAVVPSVVDLRPLEEGDGARFREMHGIAPERPLLLYLGNGMSHELQFLFAVLRSLRGQMDAPIVVVANSPPDSNTRPSAIPADLRDHIVFAAPLDRAIDLLDACHAADCLVLTPDTDTESVPLLEALAAGLPAMTISSGGARRTEGGTAIADDEVAYFAAQVQRLLQDGEARAELASAARRHVQQWAVSLAVEHVLDSYRQVIAARTIAARALAR